MINVDDVRLVLPWNAALTGGWWMQWLAIAHAQGMRVLVALDHTPDTKCPATPSCTETPVADYVQGLRALLASFPWIDQIEAWNEPNAATEPTFNDPLGAAAYYTAARQVCPACTVVAGGMLDDADLGAYLMATSPAWARTRPSGACTITSTQRTSRAPA